MLIGGVTVGVASAATTAIMFNRSNVEETDR
jgi:hypothetical protein